MSKGSSQPATSTVTSTQSNLPTYAQPYYEAALNTATGVTGIGPDGKGVGSQPQYTGQQVAGFSDLQNNAIAGANDLSSLYQPYAQNAANTLGNALAQPTQFNYQAQQYNPSTFSASQVNAPALQVAQIQGPQQYSQQALSQYMDPYIQNVVNANKAAAVQDFQTQQADRDAAAIRQGAFGGGRDAVVNGVAQNGLASRLSALENQGLESAYQNAQNQFGIANQLGLQTQLANQNSFNTTQGLGAQLGLQSQLANQSAGLQAQQMGEQSNQFGANYDMSSALAAAQGQATANQANIQNGLTGANLYSQLGTQNLANQSNALGTQYQFGAQQQGLTQQQENIDYQNFVNQRDYAKNQLAYYMGLLHGTPTAVNSDVVTQQAQPSTLSQLGGLGIAGLGLSNIASKIG
jgi:hypothetical protein